MNYDKAREIMVDTQVRPNDVSNPEIVSAFMKTPREAFVPSSRKSVAYSELEIETSEGRSLWTPRDTGKLVKLAGIKPTDIVLVVGAGSGYEAALISRLAETVIALEEGEARVDAMSERFTALGIDQAVAVEGDIAMGLPDQAPFDVIYVCGMVETLPEAWTEQLAEGGRLAVVMQVEENLGRGKLYTRAGDTVSAREGFDAFPPKFSAFDRKKAFVF
ncbi:MAG TPA: protein-L-isoaspartate O-methyltransferase [Hyphomonas atlantica]|uniref:Protein-L-isoaspartate O-methyltransferase n=1 Tax=Hyphomonas atlantica TaxID=1280948 RepID=A0A3B9KXN8_9PROT|nr:protein-L-isoaspartate O-methyltransferase [Hyphomonas atlantica]OUW88893.1 MAG: protein-L-isoaspartate(D-aspartate) O-methyltransferase [Saprospirales bacterium TMED214]OUW88894.1 MAG: protein-L-isoaspartate(D-aspartate) O-methyltransferase [Saprospirales bacterium TMED214]HAE93441.1 protein-L-isoaspartate O-methyltransferase [Hyphomonas atlantica]|tara:strand:- start:3561 stop:4214 length:654 start_codon:yes stop_codon:yes gene_type:complete